MNFSAEEFEHQLQPDLLVDQDFSPPVHLSCLTLPGYRVYATADFGKLQVFPGITSVLEKTTDQSWQKDWYGRVGIEEATRKLKEGQVYGTLLHGQTAQFDKTGSYNFDQAGEIVSNFLLSHPLPCLISLPEWTQRLQEDMQAYITWYENIEFEPIGVELPLLSQTYQIASRIDKFGKITIGDQGLYSSGKNKGKPKGNPKQVYVIVDIKSSRNGYSNPSHPLQLLFYEYLLKENYPILKDKEFLLYNWNPKGWEAQPDYKFTNQTGKATMTELELYIRLFHLRHSWKKNRLRIFGTYSLETTDSLSDHYTKESYLELLAQEMGSELPDELREAIL